MKEPFKFSSDALNIELLFNQTNVILMTFYPPTLQFIDLSFLSFSD